MGLKRVQWIFLFFSFPKFFLIFLLYYNKVYYLYEKVQVKYSNSIHKFYGKFLYLNSPSPISVLSKRAEILHTDSSNRCPSEAGFAYSLAQKNPHISVPGKNFNNLVCNFFPLIWGVCKQNFSPLASKLREEFEVTGTHTDGWHFFPCRAPFAHTTRHNFSNFPLSICSLLDIILWSVDSCDVNAIPTHIRVLAWNYVCGHSRFKLP